MFAIPFTAPSHDSLVGHVFGRFMPRPVPADVGEAAGAAGASGAPTLAAVDDMPDLAQRVREVGEW